MAREVFFSKAADGGTIEAVINFDESAFGVSEHDVSPWTIAISDGRRDLGRLVGFEGQGQTIIGMHQLKPDPAARRGLEITVFRVNDALRATGLDATLFGAFERWLLKRGWRGNVIKKMKFTDPQLVVPIREFWVKRLGFELILAEEGKWDEHVVKRWR
ncbi:MAG: hypothetical protein KatS3mg053_3520 [Candidatus Roseilinea sp.]|nr:MAG: hypothetical protein KatS3mg053_3520 [Candidatus Roseilinea sp.]